MSAVYCDWLDDYVVETGDRYAVCCSSSQGRIILAGPWTLYEFFGVRRKKAPETYRSRPSTVAS
jgi:hypothetical protein